MYVLWYKLVWVISVCPFFAAHGTFIGKMRLESNKPTQLPIDSTFHFGASTRNYIIRFEKNIIILWSHKIELLLIEYSEGIPMYVDLSMCPLYFYISTKVAIKLMACLHILHLQYIYSDYSQYNTFLYWCFVYPVNVQRAMLWNIMKEAKAE